MLTKAVAAAFLRIFGKARRYVSTLVSRLKQFAKATDKKQAMKELLRYLPLLICLVLIVAVLCVTVNLQRSTTTLETREVIVSYTDEQGRVYTTVEVMYEGKTNKPTTHTGTKRTMTGKQPAATAAATATAKTTATAASAAATKSDQTKVVVMQKPTKTAVYSVKVTDKKKNEVILQHDGVTKTEDEILTALYARFGSELSATKRNSFVILNVVHVDGMDYYYGKCEVIDLAATTAKTKTTTKATTTAKGATTLSEDDLPDSTVSAGVLKYNFFASVNGKYLFKGSYDSVKNKGTIDYSKNLFN